MFYKQDNLAFIALENMWDKSVISLLSFHNKPYLISSQVQILHIVKYHELWHVLVQKTSADKQDIYLSWR